MTEVRSKTQYTPTPRKPESFTAIVYKDGERKSVPLDNQQPKPTASSVLALVSAACDVKNELLEIRAHDDTVLWKRESSLGKRVRGSWKSVARQSGYIRG